MWSINLTIPEGILGCPSEIVYDSQRELVYIAFYFVDKPIDGMYNSTFWVYGCDASKEKGNYNAFQRLLNNRKLFFLVENRLVWSYDAGIENGIYYFIKNYDIALGDGLYIGYIQTLSSYNTNYYNAFHLLALHPSNGIQEIPSTCIRNH